jgi:colanic acid/amylovoran biosynthesis glycosyltransferase
MERKGKKQRGLAYIGARLPSLSETFVYKELCSIRSTGCDVIPVSVYFHGPVPAGSDVAELVDSALIVYGIRTALRAVVEAVSHPVKAIHTVCCSCGDVIRSVDTPRVTKRKAPFQAMAALGLARQLRKLGIYHIHAHMANTPTSIAMYAASHLGVGFSFTGHANDLFVHRSLLPEKLRRAAFVCCISEWHRRFYRQFADLPESRLPIIRCGVDTRAFEPSSAYREPEPGSLKILSVGRLVPKKGMATLLRALALTGSDSRISCDIVGDGPIRPTLEALVDALGLASRVVLHGAQPNEEVLRRLRECDVFVLACQRDPETGDQDGIPVSLMEAMAAGKCVVTTLLEPVNELVIPDQTGLCVAPNDKDALAAALLRLRDDVPLRLALAERGRQHVVREFNQRVNAERLAKLFCYQIERSGLKTTAAPSAGTEQ